MSDLVNIGFVINVIEDPFERQEALAGAFALTQKQKEKLNPTFIQKDLALTQTQ
mgnify:CR=1 FL=1